jgi:hypothetical protein
MATTGRYLYGMIRAAEDLEFGEIGIPYEGTPSRVYTVRVDSLAAVVGDLNPRQKILPLRKNLDPHHKVIREVMKTTTILPMTFGHVARSEAEIARALKRNREAIADQLDRVDGKAEMCLKVKWDVDNLFEYFIEIDPELRELRDRIFGGGVPASQAEKIELGRLFEERRTREREAETDRLLDRFRSLCTDTKVNPPKSDAMIMDLAFLVARDRVAAFEEHVHKLAGSYSAQYVFDYSGPWAPFNFVDLDLKSAAA